MLLFVATIYSSDVLPYAALVAFVVAGPIFVLLLRAFTQIRPHSDQADSYNDHEGKLLFYRILLETDQRAEHDLQSFYFSATFAFIVTGVPITWIWFGWAWANEQKYLAALTRAMWNGKANALFTDSEEERRYIRFVTPCALGVSNLVFAFICFMQVVIDKNSRIRSEILKCLTVDMHLEGQTTCEDFAQFPKRMQEKVAESITRRHKVVSACIKQSISLAVGVIVVGHGVWVFLAPVNSYIAQLSITLLYIFPAFFFLLTCITFKSVLPLIFKALRKNPIVEFLLQLSRNTWARAAFVLIGSPFVAVILVISALNQWIRRCRKLEHQGLLTHRVQVVMDCVLIWSWLEILRCVYVLGLGLVLLNVVEMTVNVVLAWLRTVLVGLEFWLIVLMTCAVGVLFFIVPMDGTPIWLFQGVVISSASPYGWSWGLFIAIIAAQVLKYLSVGMQMKLIGARLGNSKWVQQMLGVHKPMMRAIEKVLTTPLHGVSIGKVAVLCGTSDWAPNVIAGLLGCSVTTVFLALIPNVLVVSPWVVVGALYVRGDVDGNVITLFIAISLCTAGGFALFAAHKIQDALDKQSDELRRPMLKFIELDWLDYRSEHIMKETSVEWQQIPIVLRGVLVAGAMVFIIIGNVIIHASDAFFGNFSVTDDLATLVLVGHDGLVKPLGLVALGNCLAAFFALAVCELWLARFTRSSRHRATIWLDQQELQWKADRRHEIEEAERKIMKTISI
jgi:hypothetical protein